MQPGRKDLKVKPGSLSHVLLQRSINMWSDRDIKLGLERGKIKIDPFDESQIQPASVDLRLGNVFYWFKENVGAYIDPRKSVTDLMQRYEVKESGFLLLNSGCFMLGSTKERITLGNNVVSRIEGKSSLGRLGLTVHSTAGFIDPGNTDLSLTLELFNQSPLPIKLYVGMWICQLSFQYTDSPCIVPYGPKRNSRYYGDHEPVPSKISVNSGV